MFTARRGNKLIYAPTSSPAPFEMFTALAQVFAALRMPRAAALLLRLRLWLYPKTVAALSELLTIAIAQDDEAGQTRACKQLLEIDPRHIAALKQLAEIRLRNGDADAAAGLLRRLHAATSDVPMVIAVYRIALFDPERYRAGNGYVVTVRDVLLDTGYWSVLQDDRVYYVETHQKQFETSPLVGWRATADKKLYIVAYPPPTETIDVPCILLGGDENYSHWITRNLLKLSLLESKSNQTAAQPYLINADLRQYQLEYLELLGIRQDRLIRVSRDKIIACRELTIPTVICNRPGMGAAIAWLRGKFSALIEAADGPQDLIYVSRRDARRRALLNEAELERELGRLGFRIIVPGQMPVREQITTFASAKIIVAPHGAALANLIYSSPGVLVIEITSTNIAHMDDFRIIAKTIGQRLVTVTSNDYAMENPEQETPLHWNYRVNIADVLAVLRQEAPALR